MRRNERIAVGFDPETKLALRRLARAKGVAPSRLVAQLMEGMRPQLLQLAEVLERVNTDPAGALHRLDAFADEAVDELARARADSRQAECERSAGTARASKFTVEDLATGEPWKPGLVWTEDAADRALSQARKSAPDRDWVLRERA